MTGGWALGGTPVKPVEGWEGCAVRPSEKGRW